MGKGSGRVRVVAWAGACLLLASLLIHPGGHIASAARPAQLQAAGAPQARRSTSPNIVLILTDDQRWDTLWAFPNIQSELIAHGIEFDDAYVTNTLCCPSRTTILTGEYSHSTGVYDNA